MSDEELNWEIAEFAAPRLGVSVETLAAELHTGFREPRLKAIRLELGMAD